MTVSKVPPVLVRLFLIGCDTLHVEVGSEDIGLIVPIDRVEHEKYGQVVEGASLADQPAVVFLEGGMPENHL